MLRINRFDGPQDPKFEVENFQLLTIIFSENFLSVEIFLDIGSTRSEGEGATDGQTNYDEDYMI